MLSSIGTMFNVHCRTLARPQLPDVQFLQPQLNGINIAVQPRNNCVFINTCIG